jgi:hypothetical protein
METDDVAVVTVGTVLWGVVLVLTVLLRDRLADDGRDSWTAIAAAGLFLGLLGVRYVRRRRAAIRAGTHPSGDGDAPNPT